MLECGLRLGKPFRVAFGLMPNWWRLMRGVFLGCCCVVGAGFWGWWYFCAMSLYVVCAGFRGWWYLCSRVFWFLFVCCSIGWDVGFAGYCVFVFVWCVHEFEEAWECFNKTTVLVGVMMACFGLLVVWDDHEGKG